MKQSSSILIKESKVSNNLSSNSLLEYNKSDNKRKVEDAASKNNKKKTIRNVHKKKGTK